MTEIKGISACPGVVSGKVFVFAQPQIVINERQIADSEVQKEIDLFYSGRKESEAQLLNIKEITLKNIGAEEAEIFDGHIEILLDEGMEDEVLILIKDELYSADKAVQTVADQYVEMFSGMDDPYMRERAADMKDIFRRLVANILGIHIPQLSEISEPSIVVAFDLTPSDTAQMDKTKVLGFVTAEGGATSHVAIMSRTLVIPAIVGAKNILEETKDGQEIILDATVGDVILSPSEDQKVYYGKKLEEYKKELARLAELKVADTELADTLMLTFTL